jgi:hypothetical protein
MHRTIKHTCALNPQTCAQCVLNPHRTIKGVYALNLRGCACVEPLKVCVKEVQGILSTVCVEPSKVHAESAMSCMCVERRVLCVCESRVGVDMSRVSRPGKRDVCALAGSRQMCYRRRQILTEVIVNCELVYLMLMLAPNLY